MMYVRIESDEFLRQKLTDLWLNPWAVNEIAPHVDQQGRAMADRCEILMRDGRRHVAEGSPTAMTAWWWQHTQRAGKNS